MESYEFIFGVFCKSKLVFQIGTKTKCNHEQAALIVALLNLGKESLMDNHYFACDFA